MAVYRNARGELRAFPEEAESIETPVWILRIPLVGFMATQPELRIERWQRVRDYRLLPLAEVKKLLYPLEED